MTPARKPRTECCCQPVAFIIASIVAPEGDRKDAKTFACLLSGRTDAVTFDCTRSAIVAESSGFALLVAVCALRASFSLAADLAACAAADRLEFRLGIESPFGFAAKAPCHHRRPRDGQGAGGASIKGVSVARDGHSNAPIDEQSQSFLSVSRQLAIQENRSDACGVRSAASRLPHVVEALDTFGVDF